MNGFFAKLFGLFYESALHQDLTLEYVHGTIGIIMLIAVILFACVYYLGMNHARFAYKRYWFFILIACEVVIFLVSFFFARKAMSYQGLDYPVTSYLFYSFVVCLYTAVFFFVVSLLIKNVSVQLKKIPF